MADFTLSGYVPGAIGRIAELHATYYSENWGFGMYFESKIAVELSEFLRRFDPANDGFWVAGAGGNIVGSITIDGIHRYSEGAHLRWFITAPEARGQGAGNLLLGEAVDFCRKRHFDRIYLWTFKGLDAAGHLYRKWGFDLCQEVEGDQWGTVVTEQRYELVL
jgi:GNAT superfamily N-acetyltransferase